MPISGWRLSAFLPGFVLFLVVHSASAQLVEQLDKEFIRLAEQAQSCCARVDVARDQEMTNFKNVDGKPVAEKLVMEIQSSLSGIVMDTEGHVATLGEALHDVKRIWVSLYDGESVKRYKARIIGHRLESNVGLIKILEEVKLDPLPLGDSNQVKPGAIVMGVGYTYNLGDSPSFSVGIVNATDRSYLIESNQKSAKRLIQTSLNLRPGETGGPVINASCEVVGLMLTPYKHAQVVGTRQRNFSIQLSMGSTIVLPINRVKKEVEWLLANQAHDDAEEERGDRPWLGMTGSNITDEALRRQLKMLNGGVLVSYIFPGDPADQAGIRENDVLRQWNETPIQGVDHLKRLLEGVQVGEKVKLNLIREGKERVVTLPIGRY